jgi:hypothetical protein
MNLGFNKSVLSKLQKFQGERISRNQLKQLFYDNQYEIMQIWGETEGRTPGHPRRTLRGEEVYSVFGPGGRAMGGRQYWNNGFSGTSNGYIILFDVSRSGFRVFPIGRITKVVYNETTYNVV